MRWVLLETTGKGFLSPVPSQSLNVDENKISPSILLIILILSAIFFISGLFHLLVRYFFKPSHTNTQDLDSVTAFQGQLQQLFHLHDAGVDQSFIDTLPIFLYKTIIGLKNPFDCAVCLCEFEAEDKLRLLPKCSHAFHLECIDTWLLSHSTCPLCRDILLPDFSSRQGCSVFILESGSESSREIPPEREPPIGANTSSRRSSITHFSFHGGEDEFGSSRYDVSHKTNQIGETMEAKLVPVKLGKFKNADSNAGGGEGSSDSSNVDGRRCFSTGSFAYVLDDSSLLQVVIKPPTKKPTGKRPYLPLMPGHRPAMSECDCHSSREDFKGFEAAKSTEFHLDGSGDGGGGGSTNAAAVGGRRIESFSFSKIWLRSKEKPSTMDSFSRAISFRLPLQRSTVNGIRSKCPGNVQEIGVAGLGSGRSELGLDVEVGSSMSLELNPPSFARKTLLRLGGKQNKVVHSSSALMFD